MRCIASVWQILLDSRLGKRCFVFACLFWRLVVWLALSSIIIVITGLAFLLRHLELVKQLRNLIHGHRIQLHEWKRRLVAQVQEDDRPVLVSLPELEVEKTFVEDAYILGRKIRKIDG